MAPILIRKFDGVGRRAIPMPAEVIDKMLAAGTARKISAGGAIYEELPDSGVVAKVESTESESESTQMYQTKVMEAEQPKKRGRQAKAA